MPRSDACSGAVRRTPIRTDATIARPAARLVLVAAWLGFALAALFLYPLAAALNDNAFYLQWQRRDVLESVAALVLLSVPFACGIYATWPRTSRLGSLGVAAVAALPMASLTAGILQQLPFDAALIHAWDNPAIRYGVPLALAAAFAGIFLGWPVLFGRAVRGTLLVLSMIALVVVRTLIASAWYRMPPVTVDRATAAPAGGACSPVIALLFDELSFAYLYDGSDVRPEFAAIRRFAATATNYLAVTSPAHETLISLPGYLAGRTFHDVRVEPEGLVGFDDQNRPAPFTARASDGLFATARRLGFRTEMGGYYLPYCDLLGDLVDRCQSLSFYNVSRVDDHFSPLHPIATTLVLWPRQFPFGLLKNVAFARLQRDLVARTVSFAGRPLDRGAPAFRFVHFSIPHLPFVFDATGFHPPLDPLRTDPDDRYVAQIRYVDRLVDTLIAGMRRDGSFDGATVIVMSDHGFRFGGRERDPLHIPFIVKMPGEQSRVDVTTPQQAAVLLQTVLRQNCR